MLIIIAVKPRVVFFMLLSYLWPVASLGHDLRDFEAKIEPVQVSGRDLASMIGISIEDIRVYAARNNKLLPIPFQIDRKNAAGDWVWTKIPESGKRQIEIPEDEYLDLPSTRSRDLTVDDQDPPGRARKGSETSADALPQTRPIPTHSRIESRNSRVGECTNGLSAILFSNNMTQSV